MKWPAGSPTFGTRDRNARAALNAIEGEDFLYLLALYRNLHTFGRGSLHEGRTPAELAGIELPTRDWIELLDLPPDEAPAAKSADAPPPGAPPAPAGAQVAA